MKEPCGIVLRWRLWRVCKRLGIRPYKWQKDYALGKDMRISLWTRRSGKTMAVVLYGLIRKAKGKEAYYVHDPDAWSAHENNWEWDSVCPENTEVQE